MVYGACLGYTESRRVRDARWEMGGKEIGWEGGMERHVREERMVEEKKMCTSVSDTERKRYEGVRKRRTDKDVREGRKEKDMKEDRRERDVREQEVLREGKLRTSSVRKCETR